jgi:RNA polymerase sigma-70 factor (ECF subfamily)
MDDEPLQRLLDQLCKGDAAVAEQVFRTYEPYLRKVVRRQLPVRLRTRFDSIDVVQSVWADLLQGFRASGWRFESPGHLRAFLVRVTRNRFIDRLRQHGTSLDHEHGEDDVPLADLAVTPTPGPSEEAQADELWQRMLALCPPEHRELLELRRQGYLLGEIAARTGLHEGSVRRILRTLARQLSSATAPIAATDDPLP